MWKTVLSWTIQTLIVTSFTRQLSISTANEYDLHAKIVAYSLDVQQVMMHIHHWADYRNSCNIIAVQLAKYGLTNESSYNIYVHWCNWWNISTLQKTTDNYFTSQQMRYMYASAADYHFLPAWRCASAMSVCPSVRPSQGSTLLKRFGSFLAHRPLHLAYPIQYTFIFIHRKWQRNTK